MSLLLPIGWAHSFSRLTSGLACTSQCLCIRACTSLLAHRSLYVVGCTLYSLYILLVHCIAYATSMQSCVKLSALPVTPWASISHPKQPFHTLSSHFTPWASISHPKQPFHTLGNHFTPWATISHPKQPFYTSSSHFRPWASNSHARHSFQMPGVHFTPWACIKTPLVPLSHPRQPY